MNFVTYKDKRLLSKFKIKLEEILDRVSRKNKKNSRTEVLLSSSVGITGFEPATPNSRSWCANRTALHPDDNNYRKKSGYQDSNLGPPAPKAGALTGLRYIPSVP